MKKLIVLAFSVVCVLCLAGCSVKEATVWDWAQGLKQEDIVSASPWGEGNNFDALSQEETTELVILINNLTKNCFTENRDLEGGTPTFGIQIDTATKTFYINESIAPSGALEIEYDKTMWWIDNTELLDFIRKVTGDNTGLDDEDISGRAETSSGEQSNDPSLQDISVSVSEAGGGDTFELLGKNAETISQILSADSWVPDATNCASDYIVTYNGRTIYYHSECGTFNERLEQSNQSLRLSETDRETVNTIIQGAIPRDLNLDAPHVNTETSKVNTPAITETTVPVDNPQTPSTDSESVTTENVAGIFDALNKLEYQPYTCDGLPEYLLYATDGTVYSINFSEKWVWRGNSEQAELSDELISQLRENESLIAVDKPLEIQPDETISSN